jgi:endonuclease-3
MKRLKTKETLKSFASKLLSEIEQIYPEAKTELSNWSTAFQFLICIVLSAQTTDKQVNKITENLFKQYPTAKKLANAKYEEVEHTLQGINYFKTKAKHIVELAKLVDERYEGEPPKTLIELQTLPGVGYKTANVFLNDLYHSNQGIAVDTHVSRVAKSYGLTKETDPTKIAHDLEKLYPKDDWYKVNSLFVLYGRYILKAKKPDWEKVVLKEYLVI